MEPGEFHWTDGWFFRREDDGAVRIRHNEESPITIPPNEWCSIVAHVAGKQYDTAVAHTLAEQLHR